MSHNKENEEKGRPFIEFTPAELDEAAAIMGYGAVKYADLKNNRQTNYKCAAARRLQALQVTRPGVVVQARACLAHHSSAVYAVRCLHTLRRLHFSFGPRMPADAGYIDTTLDGIGSEAVFLLAAHALHCSSTDFAPHDLLPPRKAVCRLTHARADINDSWDANQEGRTVSFLLNRHSVYPTASYLSRHPGGLSAAHRARARRFAFLRAARPGGHRGSVPVAQAWRILQCQPPQPPRARAGSTLTRCWTWRATRRYSCCTCTRASRPSRPRPWRARGRTARARRTWPSSCAAPRSRSRTTRRRARPSRRRRAQTAGCCTAVGLLHKPVGLFTCEQRPARGREASCTIFRGAACACAHGSR